MFPFDYVWNLVSSWRFEQVLPQSIEAAERGHAGAQHILGKLFSECRRCKDEPLANVWYIRSLESARKTPEDPTCQFVLGRCYFRGIGVPKNLVVAVEWYTKSAISGVTPAQYNLGFCFQLGFGVEKNLKIGIEWVKKAANKECAFAEYNLGYYHHIGDGVELDLKKAFEYYTKSALQGYSSAQLQLGECYRYSLGVRENLSLGFEWYLKAALSEDALAQYKVGECYSKGIGVEKNPTKSFEWFLKSAIQGCSIAQYYAGLCYERGDGVEKNLSKAVEMYIQAACQNHVESKAALSKRDCNLTCLIEFWPSSFSSLHMMSQTTIIEMFCCFIATNDESFLPVEVQMQIAKYIVLVFPEDFPHNLYQYTSHIES